MATSRLIARSPIALSGLLLAAVLALAFEEGAAEPTIARHEHERPGPAARACTPTRHESLFKLDGKFPLARVNQNVPPPRRRRRWRRAVGLPPIGPHRTNQRHMPCLCTNVEVACILRRELGGRKVAQEARTDHTNLSTIRYTRYTLVWGTLLAHAWRGLALARLPRHVCLAQSVCLMCACSPA